jgi:hypothetical protein
LYITRRLDASQPLKKDSVSLIQEIRPLVCRASKDHPERVEGRFLACHWRGRHGISEFPEGRIHYLSKSTSRVRKNVSGLLIITPIECIMIVDCGFSIGEVKTLQSM